MDALRAAGSYIVDRDKWSLEAVLDAAFSDRDDEVHLRLVKTHDAEVICDQHGRVLHGVTGFRYEQADVDSPPVLTVKLLVKPSDWRPALGAKTAGDAPCLRPSSALDPAPDA